MKYKILTIFTTTGATYTFRDVELESINETAITFFYTALSDGLAKKATFFWRNVAGYSVHGPADEL